MSEYDDLNSTMESIMEYLQVELARGAKFISYTKIGQSISPKRKRHAVEYSIRKLCRIGRLKIRDNKLSLV